MTECAAICAPVRDPSSPRSIIVLRPSTNSQPASNDCLHATRWAAAHAAELGANPMRAAVAGDSAGANMAAVTALRVRDEGGPPLCGQLLLYPVMDYHTPGTP